MTGAQSGSRTNREPASSFVSGRLDCAIALFGALILCLLWAVVGWMIAQDRHHTTSSAIRDVANFARAFDEHVDSVIWGLDHLIELVRLQYMVQGGKLDLRQVLQHITVPPSVLHIGILDERGRLRHSSLSHKAVDFSHEDYYRIHRDRDADHLSISKPLQDRVSGESVLQLSRRVSRDGGQFAGVVLLSLDPRYFADFYRRFDFGKSGMVMIVGTDGTVRARQEGDRFTLGQDVRDGTLFRYLSMQEKGSYLAHGMFDELRRYMTYRTMRHYPLVVAVGRKENEVLTYFFERRRYYLALGFAGTALIVGCALWLVFLSHRQALHATQLLNSRASLLAFMDGVPDPGWLKDADGRFIAVNRAYARSVSLECDDIVGRTDFDLFDDQVAQKHKSDDQHVMLTGRTLRFETATAHGDKQRWMETIQVPVYDSKKAVYGTCGVSRDITERKQAETNAQEANRLLERRAAQLADANRELDAYTYTVSHDLQAPLRHISGFTRMLRDRLADYPDVRVSRLFEKVAEATARMGAMIDDLLVFSRSSRSALHNERIALDAVIGDIVEEFRTVTQERAIQWRVGALPVLEADRKLVQLAFYNLIANAVKYTAMRPDAVIEIASFDCGSQESVVYVRDNGAGFDMKDADRLFDVFERLHDEREFTGTGIGLATVKRIVDRHGGRVWAEGIPNVGATFYVAMPVSSAAGLDSSSGATQSVFATPSAKST